MRLGGIVFGLTAATLFVFVSSVPASAKDCVRAVRSMSEFSIQGDAWRWWQNSDGVYEHGRRPEEGSVLVFKKTGRLGRGHVSLVSAVVDRRTIEVDHTWDRSAKIQRGMTVVDVSPNNDWSEVRVWNGPAETLGSSVYPTYGFVLPERERNPSTSLHSTYASAGDDDSSEAEIAPTRRLTHLSAKPGKRHSPTLVAARSRGHDSKPTKLAQAKKGTRFEARTHVAAAKPTKGGSKIAAGKSTHKQVAHVPMKPTHKRADHK